MDLQQLLALYDEEERVNMKIPRFRREEVGSVIRHVATRSDEGDDSGLVIYSRLIEADADRVIQEQVDYFDALGTGFEWKLYQHDTPLDLRDRLAARGFEIGDAEAIMVLELDHAPPALLALPAHEVRRIADPGLIDEVLSVRDEDQRESHVDLADHLRKTLTEHPEMLSVYAIYVDGGPVASGWLYRDPASPFASLWGGTTLAAYRKRGYYTALLAVRVQDAIAKGARFLTIDAGPMSRPIAERLGFRCITISYPCTWGTRPQD
jgi:hypothetical protein